MGEILRAREEPQKRSALLGHVIPDRSPQHRVAGLEGVEHRARGCLTWDVQRHFGTDMRQRA
jgi:hypothetical protein